MNMVAASAAAANPRRRIRRVPAELIAVAGRLDNAPRRLFGQFAAGFGGATRPGISDAPF